MKKENQSEFEKVTSAVHIGEVTEQPTLQIVHDGETIIDTPIETLEKRLERSYSMLAEIKGLNEECGVFGIWGHTMQLKLRITGFMLYNTVVKKVQELLLQMEKVSKELKVKVLLRDLYI